MHPIIGLITEWFQGDSGTAGLAILGLSVTLGLFIGAVSIRGVRLGISGVLFSALLFGQLGLTVDPKVLQFLRDFALILFMYAIGLDVGPAFVSSLRAEGLRLNALSVAVMVLGAAMAALVGRELPKQMTPGLYAGAFTTTPGLAAAQEAVRRSSTTAEAGEVVKQMGLAYTVTYPFGIVGPVLVIPALRRLFRVRIEDEKIALAAAEERRRPPIEVADFEVTQSAHCGTKLKEHPLLRDSGIVLVRLLRENVMSVPTAETEVMLGDDYRGVGSREKLAELVAAIGKPSSENLGTISGDVQRKDLLVTRTQVLRRPLHELQFNSRYGVAIARVNRAGVDIAPKATLRLVFADRVTVVGPEAGLKMVEAELGNSPETLNRSRLIPIFLGMVLGVMAGTIPLTFPGLHITLQIGLAGGPLLVAILLSQLGNIGSIVWYMPVSSNQLFRDFGLAVFLACVGLQAGDHFIQRAAHGAGLSLLLWGAAITIIPLFLVGSFARFALKMNFITLSGWVAGAMTSTPALLFADELTHSEAPAVAYAAVTPLATLVPIICAQILAIRVM
jgi:putative transport protein